MCTNIPRICSFYKPYNKVCIWYITEKEFFLLCGPSFLKCFCSNAKNIISSNFCILLHFEHVSFLPISIFSFSLHLLLTHINVSTVSLHFKYGKIQCYPPLLYSHAVTFEDETILGLFRDLYK